MSGIRSIIKELKQLVFYDLEHPLMAHYYRGLLLPYECGHKIEVPLATLLDHLQCAALHGGAELGAGGETCSLLPQEAHGVLQPSGKAGRHGTLGG